jgi:hypothetical protein
MVKRLYISGVLFLFSISLFSQTWYSKERGEKYGYVDLMDKVKIPFEYSIIFNSEFTDSIAFVGIIENGKGKIKAIDRNNRKLFTVFNYDNGPDYVKEGLFRIQDDSIGYIGFADMDGNIIIPTHFFYADSFSEGFAAFNVGGKIEPIDEEHDAIVGGKWGYIDKTGKEIFPAIFDKAFPFEEGKAKVQIGKNVFYITKEQVN